MSEANGQPLPNGWAVAPIEDLFWPLEDGRTLHQGWSPLCEKTPAPTDADWGVLKTTAIQAGAFLPQFNKHLSKHLSPRPQTEVKEGDLLITCAGPRVRCGVACLVRATRPRLMMSGKMYRFRVSPDHFDSRYLEGFLLTPAAQSAIDKMKTGGSDSGLNLTHDRFRPLPVPVAPLNEQRRIMDTVEEVTSDLDAGVAALERVQAKLKNYRTTVLKAAVEGALTAEWREQHPATEPASALLTRILAERRRRWEEAQLRKFKEAGKPPPKDWKAKYQEPVAPDTTNLPALPEGWCWASPARIGDVQLGRQRAPQHHTGKHMRPYLRVANVYEGRIDLRSIYEMNFTPAEFETFKLRAGDILLNEGQSLELVGRAAIYRDELPGACFTNTLVRFRPEAGLLPEFALIYFMACLRSHRFRKLARWTTNIAHLGADRFAAMEIPLPPLAEQEAIVEAAEEQLTVIEHLEADLAAKLKSAQGLRQSILRHAFTGQLVPQDPNDEPAAELLKRIAADRGELARKAQAAKQTNPKPKTPRKRAAKR